jgi:hypothetical protein
MLNPGYKIKVKRKKMECDPGRAFACPHCKRVFLEAADPDKFRTKCSGCGKWIYGEKIIAN